MTDQDRAVESLDPGAAERIIRRAIDVDARRRRDDELDPEALVAAAVEVGLDPAAVREAIAVERLGAPPPPRRLDAVGGPGFVVVERVVDRSADEALDLIDAWLCRGHHLRRDHDAPVGAVWRKRGDLAATMQRTARSVTGDAPLGSVRAVHAQVAVVDDRRCVVRLAVDRRAGRGAAVSVGATVGTTSLVGGALVASVVPPLGVVAVPGLAVAGGMSVAARRRSRRLERELLRLVAHVRAGRRPAAIGGSVARRIGLIRS